MFVVLSAHSLFLTIFGQMVAVILSLYAEINFLGDSYITLKTDGIMRRFDMLQVSERWFTGK